VRVSLTNKIEELNKLATEEANQRSALTGNPQFLTNQEKEVNQTVTCST
jgi:hypothetical protein